jgi:hypothetical protein
MPPACSARPPSGDDRVIVATPWSQNRNCRRAPALRRVAVIGNRQRGTAPWIAGPEVGASARSSRTPHLKRLPS